MRHPVMWANSITGRSGGEQDRFGRYFENDVRSGAGIHCRAPSIHLGAERFSTSRDAFRGTANLMDPSLSILQISGFHRDPANPLRNDSLGR